MVVGRRYVDESWDGRGASSGDARSSSACDLDFASGFFASDHDLANNRACQRSDRCQCRASAPSRNAGPALGSPDRPVPGSDAGHGSHTRLHLLACLRLAPRQIVYALPGQAGSSEPATPAGHCRPAHHPSIARSSGYDGTKHSRVKDFVIFFAVSVDSWQILASEVRGSVTWTARTAAWFRLTRAIATDSCRSPQH